ncbi:MAG: hypothetical protein R2724_23025 [Bryobacterales bacterium]
MGSPGTAAIAPNTPDAINNGSGLRNIWREKSTPSLPSPAARVVMTPPETEINREGMIVTSPSPTVSTV